jgi:cell division septation protein DedD
VLAKSLTPEAPIKLPEKPKPVVLAKTLTPQAPIKLPEKPKPVVLAKVLTPQAPIKLPEKPKPVVLAKSLTPQAPIKLPEKPEPVVLAKVLKSQPPADIPPTAAIKLDNPLGPFRFKKPKDNLPVTAVENVDEEKKPLDQAETKPESPPTYMEKPKSAAAKHKEAVQSLAKHAVIKGDAEALELKKEITDPGKSNGAWVVNVLSTKDMTILRKTFDALIETPHQVYSYQAKVKGENWHRIRVGFFETREEAERVGRQLSAKHNLPKPWLVKPGPQELERFRQ